MRIFACALLFVGNALAEDVWAPASCASVKCSGKVIENDLGILRMCLPRAVKIKREDGEHGDRHFKISVSQNGNRHELYIVTGPYFTGRDPRAGDPRWTARQWKCDENMKGDDYRLAEGSMRTRYITLNALMGYAKYDRVPAEVSVRLDKILDSLCCGEWRKHNERQ